MTSPQQRDADTVFTTRVAIAVTAIAAVSFIASLFALADADSARRSLTTGPSLFSMSALGYCGLADFLRDSGIEARARRSRHAPHTTPATAVFLAEPDFEHDTRVDGAGSDDSTAPINRWESAQALYLRAHESGSPVVVVLPKWRGERFRTLHGDWIQQAELKPLREVVTAVDPLTEEGFDFTHVHRKVSKEARKLPCRGTIGEATVELISPQHLRHDIGLEPVVETDEGLLIGRMPAYDGSPFYVISDPDLLNNHGLARGDNAEMLLRFLKSELKATSVLMDEVTHGLSQETPFLAEFTRRPLVYSLMQALIIAGIVFWASFGTLGKPLAPLPRLTADKSTLIENTAQLLSHRGRFSLSARRYFDEVIGDVAHAFHVPTGSGTDTLAELQRLSKQRRIDVSLTALRDRLQPAAQPARRSEMLTAAGELHSWREEMLNER